mmetsp:Transcript_24487/g.73487  ORF Transcript_24487/g.73487 Transcript_24487/m.73487 type:complete len:227 (-) Transcript_24487:202-882(-)
MVRGEGGPRIGAAPGQHTAGRGREERRQQELHDGVKGQERRAERHVRDGVGLGLQRLGERVQDRGRDRGREERRGRRRPGRAQQALAVAVGDGAYALQGRGDAHLLRRPHGRGAAHLLPQQRGRGVAAERHEAVEQPLGHALAARARGLALGPQERHGRGAEGDGRGQLGFGHDGDGGRREAGVAAAELDRRARCDAAASELQGRARFANQDENGPEQSHAHRAVG